jgi:general stress protein 26
MQTAQNEPNVVTQDAYRTIWQGSDGNPTRQESIEKVRDLIKGIDIAMLTTIEDDGSLRSRPMGTQELEFDGQLWFFTFDDTEKVSEVQRDNRVNVSYADKGRQLYVSVSGTAHMVYDRAKMEQFWQAVLKVWFPEELETPNLVLMCIDVDKAEYWESDGKIATVIQMAKAFFTGSEYEGGKNEKIEFNS